MPVFSQSAKSVELANSYARAGHEAYNVKNFRKAGENYEKAYSVTGTKLYLENAAVAYSSAAYKLTVEKNYNEALRYCSKALSLQPNNKTSKELYSEIYFSRGTDYFYTGDLTKAKADIETSLKYSTSKDQRERAKDALKKIDKVSKNNAVPTPAYQENSDDSIPETISEIEMKVYGNYNKSKPLIERINRLEKDSLGKTYESDGMIVRVDRLKRLIFPDYKPSAENNGSLSSYSSENYIREIIEQSMGRVSIFGKMPVTVYIDDCSLKPYKKFYKDVVKDAFKEWETASEGRIRFAFIDVPAQSDIKVVWNESFEDFPWKPELKKEDISAEKERMQYKKASTMVQVGSILAMIAGGLIGVPVIGGIGAMGNSVASPILQYKGTKIERLSPDLKICVKPTEGLPDDQAKIRIKQIAMHQIGHAIGVFGHSNNPDDIMFSDFKVTVLSKRDINTIREIYKAKEPEKTKK